MGSGAQPQDTRTAGEHHARGHGAASHAGRRGKGRRGHGRAARIAAAIGDCRIVLCGGMSGRMYNNLRARAIQPILTDIAAINEAVAADARGRFTNPVEWLH